ncbi:MAG: PKD domain-containing protein [Bacteroidota bacterium]
MNNRIQIFPLCLLIWMALALGSLKAQSSYRALFLGNSYTYFNDLPQLVKDLALSVGDTLEIDSHTPGGYRLVDHFFDGTSQNKIMAGNWDYVVLQGQSQEPITQTGLFESYIGQLQQVIYAHNPCATIMPYMTWGRENGDAGNCSNFPVMCTYVGMDTTLRNHYLDVTDNILNGEVAPVSAVWSYLRQEYPDIDLYAGDGSHPSPVGSYAAACTFYTAIFRKDPMLLTYDFGLDPATTSIIRQAAKLIVYNQLPEWDFTEPPHAEISATIGQGDNEMIFSAQNPEDVQQTYSWDLGDGNSSTESGVQHNYQTNGTFIVQLTTSTCDPDGVYTDEASSSFQWCGHTPTIFGNEGLHCAGDTLWTESADAYQWYSGCTWWQPCIPIPNATEQFLVVDNAFLEAEFISVLSTKDGCSELSYRETLSSVGAAHSFSLLGDPCASEVVEITIEHINGQLSGFETILWYRDGLLLSDWINEDTLLITQAGLYQGAVIDPSWGCPLDTTFSPLYELGCLTSIQEVPDRISGGLFSVYPNPATQTLNLVLLQDGIQGRYRMFDIHGRLVLELDTEAHMELDISALPTGVYSIVFEGESKQLAKFIKL